MKGSVAEDFRLKASGFGIPGDEDALPIAGASTCLANPELSSVCFCIRGLIAVDNSPRELLVAAGLRIQLDCRLDKSLLESCMFPHTCANVR